MSNDLMNQTTGLARYKDIHQCRDEPNKDFFSLPPFSDPVQEVKRLKNLRKEARVPVRKEGEQNTLK